MINKKKLIIFCILILIISLCSYFIVRLGQFNYYFADKIKYHDLFKMSKYIMYLSVILCFVLLLYFVLCKNKNIKNIVVFMLLFVCCCISALSLFILNVSCVKIKCEVSGDSMYPTLYNGEQIKIKYTKNVNRYDVIVFKLDNQNYDTSNFYDSYLIKRVIGMPGDSITWENKMLFINGVKEEENYLDKAYLESISIYNNFDGKFTYVKDKEKIYCSEIPNGYIFVMGDNRGCDINLHNLSYDSREFGLVPIDKIIGKLSKTN